MRGRWSIGSLYASIAGTLYSSALLLIPFVVLLLVFWWQGGLNVDGPEVDHLHWLATTITASRWLLWPFDYLAAALDPRQLSWSCCGKRFKPRAIPCAKHYAPAHISALTSSAATKPLRKNG